MISDGVYVNIDEEYDDVIDRYEENDDFTERYDEKYDVTVMFEENSGGTQNIYE